MSLHCCRSGALACVNRVVEWDKCVAVLNSNESTTNKQEVGLL